MKFIKWIILLLLSVGIIIFAVSNRETIFIRVFPFDSGIELPLYMFFFAVLVLGIIIGGLVSFIIRWRAHREIKTKDKRIKALENEVASYKIEEKLEEKLQIEDQKEE